MEVLIVVGLIVLAIIFIIIEAFFIPGISIAGITGGVLSIVAVWLAYRNLGAMGGHIALVSTILLIGISIWGFAKSKTWDRMALKTNVESKVESIDEEVIKVGDKGTTVSRLAPMGKVKINGHVVEAKTADDFIDQNEEIVVQEVYKTNVLVKKT
ncbi:MAG: hypothetical protein GX102_05675 [Porphyromonadaceae bacterium]|jgi:membrane-bound ClpP family serine protease|nr:hypothetical protein [Porphyromonadaceae bacterium]